VTSARFFEPGLNETRNIIPPLRPPCLKSRPIAVAAMSVIPDGPPLRFTWKNQDHLVARWWGPERIETGWWRGNDVRRDYYLVETAVGGQFWVFRNLDRQTWFVHGNL
jgi:protein ImuB